VRWSGTFFLCVSLGAQVGCSKTAPTQSAGSAVVADASQVEPLHLTHSFGRVVTGKQLEHRFVVKNPFPAPITIRTDSDI
jgi:hypothetical protein